VVLSQRPDRVRVTVGDGSRLIVVAPTVRADSIEGLSEQGNSMAVALADVTELAIRQGDRMATAGTIALVGILVFLASKACFGLVSPCGGGS